jgi:hypothetical protein
MSVIVTGSVLFLLLWLGVAIKTAIVKFFIVITVELIFNLDDYLEQVAYLMLDQFF